MKVENRNACPVCGALVPETSSFCPVCILRGALKLDGDSNGSAVDPNASGSDLRFEHYEVFRHADGTPIELGRGAMGVTYKALDVDLQRPVTLKIISARYLNDESARLRFLREARAAASLRHPNVASVFHLGMTGENYFYAMEFVEGETLETVINCRGRVELKLVLEIATQVAAGLAAVHKQNLVHRDIKPTNIMVNLEEEDALTAKIIDLGLAKAVNEPSDDAAISMAGGFAGTPEFASPEQFAGIGVDIRSDLYSLGVVLWEMLAGRAPFEGSPAEVMYQHQHAPLPIGQLKGVPQPVVLLLEELLQKDPVQRFQTPNELSKAMLTVRNAIDAGRPVTRQELRRSPTTHSTKPQKGRGTLATLPRVAEGSRLRVLFWPVILLLVAGGLMVAANIFWRNIRPALDVSTRQPFSIRSVAVLPFESLSDNKSDTYFADGVQGEILNNLAKIAQLRVISRTSVMQYRADGKRDMRQIADALGVANVVEGTVRRDGNRVRVNAQLVDALSDNAVWADSYDRDLSDIFAIQSEVALIIATKLSAALSPDEKKRIEEKPTQNMEAYEMCERAKKKLLDAETIATGDPKPPILEAIQLLEQAVQLDPDFALAYSLLAYAHDTMYYREFDPTIDRRNKADKAMETALSLKPDSPEIRLANAFHLYRSRRDYDAAREQLEIAKSKLPNSAEALYLDALITQGQGNFTKAIDLFNQSIKLDPLNPLPLSDLAGTLSNTRQFTTAEQAWNELVTRFPDEKLAKIRREYYTRVAKTGDDHEYRRQLDALSAADPDDTLLLTARTGLAILHREWQKAQDLLDQIKGPDGVGDFGYTARPVPVGCYSILIAKLQGEDPNQDPRSALTRELLSQKVNNFPDKALLLSELAVLDALLGQKDLAISEGERAVSLLPISKDAVDGPGVTLNLAVVYAWAGELDLAFDALERLAKIPYGLLYSYLEDPFWDPLRKDSRFEKLRADLAP
jgi:serine/threonine protein kinase/tetratricopeptide (TPR) repeat protein